MKRDIPSQSDTSAALDAGTREVMRELTRLGSHNIMRTIAQTRGARGLAFRDGLRALREALPQYEDKLVGLHLDLGVADADVITACIEKAFLRQVPNVAKSTAASLRGPERLAANRTAHWFESEVGLYLSGVRGRVEVAVERHRRRNPGSLRFMERVELPRPRRRSLVELLNFSEQPWLDWKSDFPPGVRGGGKHERRDEHRGKLLKTLGAIANSIVDECGYLAYGVVDNDGQRTVVGVNFHIDDAELQDWNHQAFMPPVSFSYREEQCEEKRIAVFEIVPSTDYPHVCATDVGKELLEGQVWFRRGSRNTLAGHSDLKRMFAPSEPLRTTVMDGALVRIVKEFWEPQGWECCWFGVNERDDRLATGDRIAYAPESRREIRLSSSSGDGQILMLRRKR